LSVELKIDLLVCRVGLRSVSIVGKSNIGGNSRDLPQIGTSLSDIIEFLVNGLLFVNLSELEMDPDLALYDSLVQMFLID